MDIHASARSRRSMSCSHTTQCTIPGDNCIGFQCVLSFPTLVIAGKPYRREFKDHTKFGCCSWHLFEAALLRPKVAEGDTVCSSSLSLSLLLRIWGSSANTPEAGRQQIQTQRPTLTCATFRWCMKQSCFSTDLCVVCILLHEHAPTFGKRQWHFSRFVFFS